MTTDGSTGGIPTWQINKAVRASSLEPPSRLIMLVLSDIADNKTAELPPRRTPSTRQLAAETGLSKSTVKRHREELEAAGWILLTRPTPEESVRHVRIKYRLAIPATGAHRTYEQRAAGFPQTPDNPDSRVHPEPPDWVHSEPPEDEAGFTVNPHGGSERTPTGVHSEPSENNNQDDQDFQKPPAGAGDREQRYAVAEELTASFWTRHGTAYAQRREAIRAVIITAVADNAVPRNDAAEALHRLAVAGQQITAASLTAALARLREHDQARAAPPRPPKPAPGTCHVRDHSAIQLAADGTCTACTADAKGRRDEPDEPPDAYVPPPRRAPHDPDEGIPPHWRSTTETETRPA